MEPVKRQRGRPKGSRNKPHNVIRIEIPIPENGNDKMNQYIIDALHKFDNAYSEATISQLPRKRLDSSKTGAE